MTATPAHIRVLRRCIIGDCWDFTGAKRNGYGVVGVRKSESPRPTHRVVWEALVGPIPEGMTLDHLCRNRACCNPDHLRILSRGANVLAGYGPSAIAARRTACIKGHEFTEQNTYISKKGHRHCRRCHAGQQVAQYAARQKAQSSN